MQVTSIGLKGWEKDGVWHWTPEVVLAFDPIYPQLEKHQVTAIQESIEQLKSVLCSAVEEPRTVEQIGRDLGLTKAKEAIYPRPGEGQPGLPGYNPTVCIWEACPECGAGPDLITHLRKDGKGDWQGCKRCGIGLKRDGTTYKLGEKPPAAPTRGMW